MVATAQPRRSLKVRLAWAIGTAATVIAVAYFVVTLTMTWRDLRRSLFERADTTADVLASSLTHPMWEIDMDQVVFLLDAAYENRDVAAAWVDDERGHRYASIGEELPADESIVATVPIVKGSEGAGQKLGEVTVVLSLRTVKEAFQRQLLSSAIALVGVLGMMVLVLFRLLPRFTGPIEQMSEAVGRYAQGEKKVELPAVDTDDEVGNLSRSLRDMMTEIDAFEDALHEKVDELAIAKELADSAEKTKREFLATMSHELRTPMNGILGMTELLIGVETDGERREQLATIKSSADLLLEMVNDILDFSLAESGRLEIRATPFSLRACVSSVATLHGQAMAQKELRFTTHFGDELPDRVSGDAVRIRQVLTNLLGNAQKFTPEGGRVALDVGAIRDEGDRCVLRFAVSDTGIGIPGAKQSAIFHAFTQLDGSHSRRFGGTGLGLAIANHLVRLMGGELRVTSQTDRGSTFWFTVPVEKVAAPAETPAPAPPEAARERAATPLRVLLAEDNRVNQKVAVRALERCGHQVVVVDDGAQAVRAVSEQAPFDCVLMDLQMPEMDGTEATRAIRERERETGKHLRIIALTANVMEGDREACLAAGMDDFLAKPLKLPELEMVLQRATDEREARWGTLHTSAA